MRQIMIGLAFALVATPVVAQQPSAKTAVTDKAPVKPERMICKRSAPAGSLIETRRDCHTRAEWGQIAQAARATGQDMVDRSATGGH
ncbi:hypothetical protein [Sphingomonas faeni]|uniref:hypothetical protein n=1 Tax=Sphingomonas faeni TaxID=185950 RepID=UPI0027890710|nr:hypothetical protein [Sphingomonas faeni]MDQ0836810.1 hypothetical protein [Sphingomonas faeni]